MENEQKEITEIKKSVKEKNKKMTQEEAFELIQEWGDIYEVRLIDDDFEAVQKEIWQAVVNERLTFDEGEEIFTYKLKKPIKDKSTGQDLYSLIKLQETPMEEKKGVTKYKDDIDTNAAFFKSYCTDMEGNKIEHGFLTRIYDRDQHIISAIILGFFVQAVPGPIAQK